MPPARKPAKTRSKKARARRSPVPWPPRLPMLRAAPPGPHRPRPGGRRRLPRLPALRGLGGRRGGPGDRRRADLGRSAASRGPRRWRSWPPAPCSSCAPRSPRACGPSARARCACSPPPAWGSRSARWASGRATARPSPSAVGTSARSWPTRSTRLFSDVGAHILAIFLFCAALLLLTGATIAGRAALHRRAGGRDGAHAAPAAALAREPGPGYDPDATQPLLPPDLEDEEVVIRPATRTGELDGALRYPDLFEAAVAPPARVEEEQAAEPDIEPEPEPLPEPPAAERERRGRGPAAARAPRPRRRRVPPARHPHPQALERRAGQARHRGPGEDGHAARRGPRPPGRAGAGHRRRRRPAHHALRAAARARREDGEGRQPQERPRLRAGRHRDPHPRPDPGQARGRRRGPQPPPPGRHPRRRLLRAARATSRRSPCGWARTSRARRSPPTWPRCPTCWWPAPPARASRAPSTRCSPRSCCARRPTRCASSSSTPSRSSSTTTRRSRTCSRRSSPARGWRPTRCRTSCARWNGATA